MDRRMTPLLALVALLAPSAVRAAKVTVPVDIGIGPCANMFFGPIHDDQPYHWGLVFSIEAIIDHKTIVENKKRIPKQYRAMAMKIDEVRYSPSIFVPDTLFISPKLENTGIYGVSLRPVKADVPLVKKPVRLAVGLGLRVSYAYISSDGLDGGGAVTGQPFTMHWLRPGIDGLGELEIPFSDSFLISGGWDSQLYLPQPVGGEILSWGDRDESIWHVGQPFVKLHFRVPYTVHI